MRITFTRSGGFAGVRLHAVVNEEELSAETAAQLRQLVDGADCFRLPGKIATDHKQPDRFQYELILEDGERQHSILVDEEAAPPTLLPLLEWLTDVARG
jgi:hypothetical protein